MRVLVIEDDSPMSGALKNVLQAEKIICDIKNDASTGIAAVKINQYYDAILLDLMLPDAKGTAVIKTIRKRCSKIPILVLSNVKGIESKIECFKLGADDFLEKPFHREELMQRLYARIRRSVDANEENEIHIGPLSVGLNENGVLKIYNQVVKLTKTEFKIIQFLAMNKNTILSKQAFYARLYEPSTKTKDEKIIDVFIHKVKKKLKAFSQVGEDLSSCIHTYCARGYSIREV